MYDNDNDGIQDVVVNASKLREGILSNAKEIDSLSENLTADGQPFYFDKKNGVYGWNESSARGADTFHPFRSTTNTTLYKKASAGDSTGTLSSSQNLGRLPIGTVITFVCLGFQPDSDYGGNPSFSVSGGVSENWSPSYNNVSVRSLTVVNDADTIMSCSMRRNATSARSGVYMTALY